ncbi:MAG: glucose-6-phosphate dehydrogenase [Myxococcales bacterium]|nr:glucose-6-phosphate dehydrogenase [Myxococcales bacterium]
MNARCADPTLLIIFGGTGDLSRRKLLPALGRLAAAGLMHGNSQVLALGRSDDHDDTSFRALTAEALAAAKLAEDALDPNALHYQATGSPADFAAVRARIERIEKEAGLAQSRVFYLALPPQAFAPTITGLGEAGLNRSEGNTRLVVEKPFGRDFASAHALNQVVHRWFDESQIYRIDHYLGKDPVQNLLVLRLANAFIESLWNRNHVEAVQITAAESLGVGTRAGYYDHAGALRDMVQNHLTQLMTLVAMEPPTSLSAEAIRREKIKVLEAVEPLSAKDIVRGRYTAGSIDGKALPAYVDSEGVAAGSTTETFVALRLGISNWRWQGVPFYLRTGKALARRLTEIAIRFRGAPVHLFESLGVSDTADVLRIRLQPDEGFSLHIDVKIPGTPFRLQRIPLSFSYDDRFDHMPEAYTTLLHDVLCGDQTLFVHADEVESSWRAYAPLLDATDTPFDYAPGSWGPCEAECFEIPDKELWRDS